MPVSDKKPDGWPQCAYCRERGLYLEQVERWRQTGQDANEKSVLTLKEQKERDKLRAQDQREIKALNKELQRKGAGHGRNGGLAGAPKN